MFWEELGKVQDLWAEEEPGEGSGERDLLLDLSSFGRPSPTLKTRLSKGGLPSTFDLYPNDDGRAFVSTRGRLSNSPVVVPRGKENV